MFTLRVFICSFLSIFGARAETQLRGTLETGERPQDFTIELRASGGSVMDVLTAMPGLNGQFDFPHVKSAHYVLSVKNRNGDAVKEEQVFVSGAQTEITVRLAEKPRQGHGTVSVAGMKHRTPKAARKALSRSRKCRSRDDEDCLERALDEALAADPDLLEAYVNRSALRARRRQWELAVGDIEQALRLDPRCATAHANRAFIAVHRKDYPQALISARAALRSDPGSRSAQYSLALAQINLGEVSKGFRQLEELGAEYEPARRTLTLVAPYRARLEKAAQAARGALRAPASGAKAFVPTPPDPDARRAAPAVIAIER